MDDRLPRAERRRRTEGRILDEARRLFAERGFERTTIRSVAAAAEIDPALVMQYFGNKQALFSAAVKASQAVPEHADPVEHVLATIGLKIGELPQSTLAMMRSMLTHPEAAVSARQSLNAQVDGIARLIPADDARLRAALITSIMLGVTVGHQLLEVDALREADPEDVAALLRPALRAITGE